MLQPIASLRRVPVEIRRQWFGIIALARRLAGRRARPTRDELMAMTAAEFEVFLEQRGTAERLRRAVAESEAQDH